MLSYTAGWQLGQAVLQSIGSTRRSDGAGVMRQGEVDEGSVRDRPSQQQQQLESERAAEQGPAGKLTRRVLVVRRPRDQILASCEQVPMPK